MDIKNIANIIPLAQAASLANENVKVLNKKKVNSKDMLKLGVTNIVGTSIIKMESDFIGSL